MTKLKKISMRMRKNREEKNKENRKKEDNKEKRTQEIKKAAEEAATKAIVKHMERIKKKKKEEDKKEKKENSKRKKRWKCMAWNIDGWNDTMKTKRKIHKIKSEIQGYDIVILNETHLDKVEVERFEKFFDRDKNYTMYHATRIMKDKDKGEKDRRRNGVSIIIRNNIMQDCEIEIEKDDVEGRWIKMKVQKDGEKDMVFWGIYAPVKPTERKKWMKEMGKRMKKVKGRKMIAGDYNFIMDSKYDKIGGNANKGKEGKAEQKIWERELNVRDIWRRLNPKVIATTRSTGDRDSIKDRYTSR